MFIFSFIKSFVLYPDHYEWAAFNRDGICLSYLFGIGSLLAFILLIVSPMPLDALIVNEFVSAVVPEEFTEQVAVFMMKNIFLLYPLIIVLTGFVFAIWFFNIALVTTILISQPFNFLTSWIGENLTFMQLLRSCCYSITASTVFGFLAIRTLGAGEIAISLITLFYICAPIIYLKMVHDS